MNVLNKALASTFLTASMALGAVGAAEAAGPLAAPSLDQCVSLGQSKGVYEYPAAQKGFQQQGSLACEFGYGAGQQFIPIKSYDMNNPRDAQAYTRSINAAENTENRAGQNAQRQAEAEQRRAEAEARKNGPIRQIQDGVRDIRNLDNARKQLESIFRR